MMMMKLKTIGGLGWLIIVDWKSLTFFYQTIPQLALLHTKKSLVKLVGVFQLPNFRTTETEADAMDTGEDEPCSSKSLLQENINRCEKCNQPVNQDKDVEEVDLDSQPVYRKPSANVRRRIIVDDNGWGWKMLF